jgi:pantoate--beta-alanine ligase/L-aspartate-alpha-decarboxylase
MPAISGGRVVLRQSHMTESSTASHATYPQPAVVRTVPDLRAAVEALRAEHGLVTLVPTMGAFHEGHLSLMRQAAEGGSAVVVSLFVNPTQFAPTEDLSAYPRDEQRDLALAAGAGAHLVWAPEVDDVYPSGYAMEVTIGGPADVLEGASRPHHFAGVATVVAKLLTAVRPDRVVFGQKDAQQVAVIRRLMADLHLDDIQMIVGPIVREDDGLAMSSRNAYLGPEDRAAAVVLSRALAAAAGLAEEGEADVARLEQAAMAVLEAEPRCEPEYATVVDPASFAHQDRLEAPALLCVAARVGPARLIDNRELPVPTTRRTPVPRARTMLKSKIHRATVTDANLNYVGSITVDRDLLDLADIREYEKVSVLNINTGARFETYAIDGPRGRGDVCLNGAAARLAHPGDLVIILTYAEFEESELVGGYEPTVVHVNSRNEVTELVEDMVPVMWEVD